MYYIMAQTEKKNENKIQNNKKNTFDSKLEKIRHNFLFIERILVYQRNFVFVFIFFIWLLTFTTLYHHVLKLFVKFLKAVCFSRFVQSTHSFYSLIIYLDIEFILFVSMKLKLNYFTPLNIRKYIMKKKCNINFKSATVFFILFQLKYIHLKKPIKNY